MTAGPVDGLLDELAGLPAAPGWFRRRAAAWLGYRVIHEASLPGGGSVRVLERDGVRHLRFGDAWEDQSAIALDAPARPLLPYTRLATVALALPPRLDAALHLGLGGGTLPRVLHAVAPHARQDAVEPFPEVVDAARRWFALPPSVRVTLGAAEDAVTGLLTDEAAHRRYDLVVLDAFDPAGAPVAQTPPTFARLRRLLRPDGWLVVNCTHDVRARVAALHRVYASVAWRKLPDTDQYVLLASDAPALLGVRGRASAISTPIGLDLEALLDALTWADGSILAGVSSG